MTPKIECAMCGSSRFTYPMLVTDNSTIECQDCGSAVGTFAELRSKVAVQIAQATPAAAA